MAEPDVGGKLGFLTHKLGPLPIGVWIVAAGGIYWWMARRSKGTSGQATDPAGNVGIIDPKTGYVYGSSQDTGALSGGIGGGGTSSSGSDTSGSTVGGSYPDNTAWGRAAINYLVARGVDPTEANEAIQEFLQGLPPSSSRNQADVNLAVQALNAPPTPPAATGVSSPPIVSPPGGITYAANPPSGMAIAGKTTTTVTVKWNKVANASGYTVSYGTTSAATDGSVTASSATSSATVGGLKPGTLYYFRVQATPAKAGAPYGTITTSTSAVSGGPTPTPGGGGGHTYTVKSGDTLTGIARRLGVSESTLYAENKTTIEDAAHRYGHPSSNNGNLIFPGTVLRY